MSEESDQVWESMSGELRKVRRRQMATRMGALAAVAALGVFFGQRLVQPGEERQGVVVETSEEAPVIEVAELEQPQLAVLVYDGEGMRFELMDGEQLGRSEMKFSLQPVVMGLQTEAW